MSYLIEINSSGQPHESNLARIRESVQHILEDASIETAEISIAIVSDEKMQQLNRRYLDHDYPTDVLSFLLDHDAEKKSLEGQIIASSEYAEREAPQYGWTTGDELLLYVIHGCLHLVGHDDSTPEAAAAMRQAEVGYLERLGLKRR